MAGRKKVQVSFVIRDEGERCHRWDVIKSIKACCLLGENMLFGDICIFADYYFITNILQGRR